MINDGHLQGAFSNEVNATFLKGNLDQAIIELKLFTLSKFKVFLHG